MIAVQKLLKSEKDSLQVAILYYSLISALNNLELGKRKIQLLAFTAIRGTITPLSARKEFIRLFNSSLASIENMKINLVKKGMIQKDADNMYRVNPQIVPDFSNPSLILQITLNQVNKEEPSDNK